MSKSYLLWLCTILSVLSTAQIQLLNMDLDERYFYYLAISREPKKALLCKRQSYDEYTNDICPLGNNTKTDETNFKFYMKIVEQEENSIMLFDKASQQAISIHLVELQEPKLPIFRIVPEPPNCHSNQIFRLFRLYEWMREDLNIMTDDGKIHTPYILLGTEFCKQASYNKNSCILQPMNNSARFIPDGEIINYNNMHSEDFVYLLPTPESKLHYAINQNLCVKS